MALKKEIMSYAKLYYHFVWCTKNRLPLITYNLKPKLIDHYYEYTQSKNFIIKEINCVKDHVHALIGGHVNTKIPEIAQHLKGESSHWINQNFNLN